MNKTLVIAKKEFKDILRSKIFLYLLVLLLGLTLVSILVSEFIFNDQVTQYNNSLQVLQSIGKQPNIPIPQLFPLNLLRGVVDYIEIIGAILGIFLGYISIFKEKNTKAIKLILTRPIKKTTLIYGKLLGNFVFVITLLSVITLLCIVTLFFIGGAQLGSIEFIKFGIFIILSSIYILIFFTLSFFFSLHQKNIVNALILSFVIWLIFALIFPQIGDTMDTDNQVPGGFFETLGLTKDQETNVMSKFNRYESVRTGVEQLSITKHYERAIFALFGIKKKYNDMSLGEIFRDQWGNMLVVILFLCTGIWADVIFLRKNTHLLNN